MLLVVIQYLLVGSIFSMLLVVIQYLLVGSISKCLREGMKELSSTFLFAGGSSPALIVPSQSFDDHG
jgi:hypothetical protein